MNFEAPTAMIRFRSCILSIALLAILVQPGCNDRIVSNGETSSGGAKLKDAGSVEQESSAVSEARAEITPPSPAAPTQEQFAQFAFNGDLPRILLAVERGADINAADESGRTPLMLAAFNGHSRVVKFLLDQKAEVNSRDATGRTALMYAATIDQLETVTTLLEGGAEVNLVDNDEGFTALMFAAGEGHVAVIERLLSAGARRDIKDIDGDTALDFAKRNGHQAAAERLARE